jgi:hypothetical protein
MDQMKLQSDNSSLKVADLYKSLGFKVKQYDDVTNLIQEWSLKLKSAGEDSAPQRSNSKNTIGVELTKHISAMNSTEICLTICNLDPIKAMEVYRTVDFRVVHEAFNLWSKTVMLDLTNSFEVGVVAAGGSLSGSSKTNTVTHSKDLPNNLQISF